MNTSHYHERMSIKVGIVDELCLKNLALVLFEELWG